MEQNHLTTKARTSLLLLAMIAGLSACGKEKTEEAVMGENSAGPSAHSRGVAYVTNQDAGVTVIDLASLEVVKTLDVKAESPRGLGITEDGKQLVVATRENHSVSVINTETGEVAQQIEIGKNPEFVRIRGNYAFVSFEPSSKGGPPPKPGEAATEEDDDDENAEPARIAVVDLQQGKKVREIVGGPETEGIEFSADGKQLIITNEADNTITVHDLEAGTLLKTIETKSYGNRPRGIKISPDGNTYLSTLEYGNKFMVMDKEFNVLRTVDTGETPYGISYDRAGNRIFVASNKAEVLQVYDATSFEKIKDITTGKRCWHFSFTPDDKQILLACGKSDAVFVIDAEKLEVIKQIAGKAMPWGVVTYPKSMGSLDQP